MSSKLYFGSAYFICSKIFKTQISRLCHMKKTHEAESKATQVPDGNAGTVLVLICLYVEQTSVC